MTITITWSHELWAAPEQAGDADPVAEADGDAAGPSVPATPHPIRRLNRAITIALTRDAPISGQTSRSLGGHFFSEGKRPLVANL
jgi:hypothetical protein